MPRDDRNQYYNCGLRKGSSAHRMIETGAGGKTGAEFIKMLVEDVDSLMQGRPAVLLTGLLATARISFNSTGELLPQITAAVPTPSPTIRNSALARASRARKSYNMDDEKDEKK